MTEDQLQQMAAQIASALHTEQQIDGVVVFLIDKKLNSQAMGIIVPDGDLDTLIGSVVQMLGALRNESNAGTIQQVVEDDGAVETTGETVPETEEPPKDPHDTN